MYLWVTRRCFRQVSTRDKLVEMFKNQAPVPAAAYNLDSTFFKFSLRQEVQLGVFRLGIKTPTKVQDLVIPQLVAKKSLFFLGQTGSGKTLAYMLPIFHHLLAGNPEKLFPKPKKPRALVLVPTRELAIQALKALRQVTGYTLQSTACTAGLSYLNEIRELTQGRDLIVATPWRFLLHMEKKNLDLQEIRHIVVDEADTLCDSFYADEVRKILNAPQRRADCQLVFVAATRTSAITAFVNSIENSNVTDVVSPDSHLIVPQLSQVFIPLRKKRRLDVIKECLHEVKGTQTLIFTNSVTKCKSVLRSLAESGVNVVSLHGELKFHQRNDAVFKFQTGQSQVLVTTNLGSRGLDFPQVGHVIMHDFPTTIADYLHRVGRTARAGRVGRVSVIVSKRNLPMVKRIQDVSRSGGKVETGIATATQKRLDKAQKLYVALEEYMLKSRRKAGVKYNRAWKIRRGLGPAMHVGSPEKKALIKKLRYVIRKKQELKDLWKRKRVPKGVQPSIPNVNEAFTETQSESYLDRNSQTGVLQMLVKKRQRHIQKLRDPGFVEVKPDNR